MSVVVEVLPAEQPRLEGCCVLLEILKGLRWHCCLEELMGLVKVQLVLCGIAVLGLVQLGHLML